MFTQNEPDASILGHDDELFPAKKATSGGSSDTDANDPTARPTGTPSEAAVITVTPVGKWPSTWRYVAASTGACSLRSLIAATLSAVRSAR